MYLLLIANVYFTPFYSDTFVIQIPISRAQCSAIGGRGRLPTPGTVREYY